LELEIWGRAQRKAARRRKADWGDNLGGGEIPLVATSRAPNAVALAYIARAVSILGESTFAPITFFSVDQSTKFSLNMGRAIVDHLLFRFLKWSFFPSPKVIGAPTENFGPFFNFYCKIVVGGPPSLLGCAVASLGHSVARVNI